MTTRPLSGRSSSFALLRQTLLAIAAIAIVCSVSASAAAATVTDLKAVHRSGQTFVTFTKNAGSDARTTYDVYRETSPITTISGKKKIATLDADSWHLLYPDVATGQATPHLSSGFIISDLGTPLVSTQGLLVWTTATSGCYYYAVTNSNETATINLGTNSLASCATEMHQTTSGGVLLQSPYTSASGFYTVYKYFRWEDYSIWKIPQWGYYGHRVNVYKSLTQPQPTPVMLELHSAGFGYAEPTDSISYDIHATVIIARDLGMDSTTPGVGNTDPYTAPNGFTYGHSNWFGRYDPETDLVYAVTEQRITDYVKLTLADAWDSSGSTFNTDPNRVYVEGASMGAGAMHVASHYPTLFAAAGASVGYVDTMGYGGIGNNAQTITGKHMSGVKGSPLYENYEDMKWLADNGYRMGPILHTYNKDDGTVNPAHYPAALTAFESARLPFAAAWGGHTRAEPADVRGHSGFAIDINGAGGAWDMFRFLLNEAYPAFSNSANSNAVGSIGVVDHGQRNVNLDWGSTLHPIGAPIDDTFNSFGMTLKSLDVDTLADVTIRNAQQFRPVAGTAVTWQNVADGTGEVSQTGSTRADANGLITIRLRITKAGNRLALSCATCSATSGAEKRIGGTPTTPGIGRLDAPPNVRIVRE